MVSGFLTSPLDHARIWSAVARPIRSSSKKFTSNTKSSPPRVARSTSRTTIRYSRGSLEIRPRRLATTQVDPQLLRGAEDVLVGLPELDLFARRRANLDVQAEGLHLLDEDLERLRDARLGDVLALHDGLVDLDAAEHVVGLDREQLLEGVRGAIGLERPHLHLAEPLSTDLRLPAQRLLGDHGVRTGRPRIDLVVHEVQELQDVGDADRHGFLVGLTAAAVEQPRLADLVHLPEPVPVGMGGGQRLEDLVLPGTVEHRGRDVDGPLEIRP